MNVSIKTVLLVAGLLTGLQTVAQKKVQSFEVSRVIKASASDVWKVVGDDFGAIANSHPKIISSDYIGGTLKSGEGAERVCNFNDKGTRYTHEKQIDYDPDHYTFKARVFHAEGFPLDTDYSIATYRVEPIDASSSRLVFHMDYRTKPAFMGSLAKGNMKKTLSDYLIAVEHHVLTGEKVTQDNFKSIRKNYKS